MKEKSNPNKVHKPNKEFKEGDIVLAKRMSMRKGDLPFHREHYKVVSGSNSGYTIINNAGKSYRRHAADLKLIPNVTPNSPAMRRPQQLTLPDYISPSCRVKFGVPEPVLEEPMPPPPRPIVRRRHQHRVPQRSSARLAHQRSLSM